MFLSRTLSIRWAWLILFGLTTIAGDALHWIPGVQCCTHRHVHSSEDAVDETLEHTHDGHAHHHHDHSQQASTPTTASLHATCTSDCSICRWLALQSIETHAVQCEISAPHVAIVLPLLISTFERDLPRYSAPRGPPTLFI